MKRSILASILLFVLTGSKVYGMAAPSGKGGSGGIMAILPLIFIFVIFYFLLIMPQRQQRKKHKEMLENLNRGNKVVTSGGIHGTITRIEKDTLIIKVSEKTELKVDKSVIARVVS